MKKSFLAIAGLAIAGLVIAGPAVAAGPSFDCAAARLPVEKAICADPALAEADLALSRAYRQAAQRVAADAAASAELKASQRGFVATRNEAFGHPSYELADHLARRTTLLTNINIDERKTLLNDWATTGGTISVNRATGGQFRVFASASDEARGAWTCEFIGFGRPKGDTLTIAEEPGHLDYEGWTLTLRRVGRLLEVTETPPSPDPTRGLRPFCGARGSLAGKYFGVSDEGHGDDMGSGE